MVAADGVLSNDSDPDATDVLNVSAVEGAAANVGAAVTLASGAIVTMNADGSYSYDTNGAFNGLAVGESTTDTFTYTADDGNGGTDTATVTVTINGANDGPTAGDDAGSVGEDGTLVVAADGVLSNDSDPDATDVLSVSAVEGAAANVGAAVTLASGAIVTMNADGSYSYDTNGAFNGLAVGESTTDTFTYTADDGNGGTDTATVTVTINGANDGPTAGDDAGSVAEDGTLVVAADGVLSNDSDPDATDVLNVSAVEGAAANVGAAVTLASGAIVTMNADGSYSYDTNGAFNGLAVGESTTDTFTYTADDGNGGTDTATVTVTINGANDGPTAGDDAGSVAEDGTLVVAADGVLSNDSDPDATDVLNVSAVEGAAANVGAAVTLASGAIVTMNADGSYSYDTNGAFNGLAVGESTTDTFTYTADDGNGGTDTATVTVTINGANDGPTAGDDAGAVGEDGTLVVAADGVLSNDSDPDSDPLTVTEVNGSAANVGSQITLLSGALLMVNLDGSYSYDTNGAFESLAVGSTATESFTYTVDDGNGGTDTATVTITINGANDAPVAGDDTGTVDENAVLTVPANGVLANDSDIDLGDSFSISAVEGLSANIGTQVTLASGALLTLNADGSYSYDPNGAFDPLGGQFDTDTFTYTVTDSQGATDTATVTVNIFGVNSSPAAVDDTASTGEDDLLSVNAVSGVLSNDSDPDGDPLAVGAVEGSAANVGVQITLTSGALLTLNADGSYDYDPNGAFDGLADGQPGTDSFTYTADDGNGGSSTATVTVSLTGANDGPTAVDDLFVVDNIDPSMIDFPSMLGNDIDPDAGDTLTLTSIDGQPIVFNEFGEMFFTLASGAEVFMYDDFSLEYLPSEASADLVMGQVLTDTISYTIEDASGATSTASITFVAADNDIAISDLNGPNGFTINGVALQDLSGHSVSGAGDVNGDGFDDFIIGAHQSDPNGVANAGTSYVVFGNGSGFGSSLNLSTLDGTNGFALEGATSGEFSGLSVASAGDVNGDGFDDVVIGARGYNNDGSSYVVFGSDAGFGATFDLGSLELGTGVEGFKITGIDAEFSDITVSSAGDFNGDGIDDIIIGSQGGDPGGVANAGESYVVFGQAGGFGATLDVSSLDGTNGFAISGADASDNSGLAVSAGDLNNDGYDDVVVGGFLADPNGANDAGEIYVVYGGEGVQPADVNVSTLDGTNGFVINGTEAGAQAGRAVSSAGDVNGDGIDDLLIGAPKSDYDLGGAYVVFGQDGGLGASMDLDSLDGTNGFRIVGASDGGQAGYSVASAGDINGDGFDDILVGAPKSNFFDSYYGYDIIEGGETFVVFGTAAGFGDTLDLSQLDGRNGFIVNGPQEDNDNLGNSVSSAGDINGDGYDDLIIGSPKVDSLGNNDSGASYVLYGQDFQGNVTHQGTAAADTLTGDIGANVMIGGQGDDFLTGAGGMDVLYGGEGNDTLAISDLAPQRIDGGTGEDTLQIDGASLAIDLGGLPISGIETVDIAGTGDNTLTLSVMDVLDASDSSNVLRVLGDAGDAINTTELWTQEVGQVVEGTVTFDVYTSGQATLMVDADIDNAGVIV